METVEPVAADDSSGANPSSVKSDDSSPRHESGRGSPPPNCAICLGTCRNKSFTDSCLHQFCFKCLLTWSKVKAECPLCKQNFKSIIHNVRSNHQYEEYLVEQRETEEPNERLDLDNTIAQATRRFRYRTTMTLPRRDTLAIQQLLLQYPMAGLVPGAALPVRRRRRSPASFRRTVYRHRLWARPLPDFTGRFRDCSPHFYRYNDTQMHRLVPWLNRELHYLLNENIGHISYVITRILELLPQYHINSPEFREALRPYFRDRTEHFLHELYCFASTPYDMTGYDRNVQYTTDTRISTMINEVISSSESEASADSDIVMVSSSEPAEPPAGPSRAAGPSRVPQPVYPQNYISEPANNNGVIPIETISQSDTDDDSSEVLVVGYIKPPQDRTPEVVDLLGSDSDVIVQDTVPPEQATSAELQGREPAARVKLVLKRHVSPDDSDSEDSTYRPPARRRRRPRSHSTGDQFAGVTENSTGNAGAFTPPAGPSAPPIPPARPTPGASPPSSGTSLSVSASTSSSTSSSSSSTTTPSSSTSSSTSSTPTSDTYSDCSSASTPSSGRRTKVFKRKSRRKNRKSNDVTKYRKKTSSKKRPARPRKTDKVSKRKTSSGRGTKSSKKNESTEVPSERAPVPLDQPSTSGLSSTSNSHNNSSSRERSRRQSSRESRRLKSVVNVMYNKKVEESSSSVTSSTTSSAITNSSPATSSTTPESGLLVLGPRAVAVEARDYENSDWDDDLPLNLTVQKTLHSL